MLTQTRDDTEVNVERWMFNSGLLYINQVIENYFLSIIVALVWKGYAFLHFIMCECLTFLLYNYDCLLCNGQLVPILHRFLANVGETVFPISFLLVSRVSSVQKK